MGRDPAGPEVAAVAAVGEHGAMVIVGIVLLAAVPLSIAILTGLGEHRRSGRVWLAVVAGFVFPIAWVVWYVKDERPWSAAGTSYET